jgi:hypothetical protein
MFNTTALIVYPHCHILCVYTLALYIPICKFDILAAILDLCFLRCFLKSGFGKLYLPHCLAESCNCMPILPYSMTIQTDGLYTSMQRGFSPRQIEVNFIYPNFPCRELQFDTHIGMHCDNSI